MITEGIMVICTDKAVSPFPDFVGTVTEIEHGRAYVRFSGLLGAWMMLTEIRPLNAIERLARLETDE